MTQTNAIISKLEQVIQDLKNHATEVDPRHIQITLPHQGTLKIIDLMTPFDITLKNCFFTEIGNEYITVVADLYTIEKKLDTI